MRDAVVRAICASAQFQVRSSKFRALLNTGQVSIVPLVGFGVEAGTLPLWAVHHKTV